MIAKSKEKMDEFALIDLVVIKVILDIKIKIYSVIESPRFKVII